MARSPTDVVQRSGATASPASPVPTSCPHARIEHALAALAVTAAFAAAPAQVAEASTLPAPSTGAARAITSSSAVVWGSVAPGSSYYVRYWTARAPNRIRRTRTFRARSRGPRIAVSVTLPSLKSKTRYSYDFTARSRGVIVHGAPRTFATHAAATASPAAGYVPETNPQTTWAPTTDPPLSDAAAAALITPEPENRPENAAANDYVPTDAELAAYYAAIPSAALNDPLLLFVTGRPGISNPSTDDLIQWAAHKWGIPEDWIRAQAVHESRWRMSKLGDPANVTPTQYLDYPAQAQIGSTALGPNTVYQSMGLMQAKWVDVTGGIGAGIEPLRWESTAFNLDYYASYVRWLYDGYTSVLPWVPNIYAGNQWQSIGGWYGGAGDSASQDYIVKIQNQLSRRVWLTAGF